MLRFLPDIFLRLARTTGTVRSTVAMDRFYGTIKGSFGLGELPSANDRIEANENEVTLWSHLESQCNELGLDAAAATAKRLQQVCHEGCTTLQMHELLTEFDSRVVDQLASRLCWMIEPDKARFFTEPNLFGPEVAEAFPSAILDIEEAGKCLALDRGTAGVFHLMRVMEVGLNALAVALGIPYAPSWDSYLKQINKQFALDWKDKEPQWKQDEAFYSAAAGDLMIVKNAWRNPTMHVRINYDPEKALDVFNGVRTFMQHLATKLKEPPA